MGTSDSGRAAVPAQLAPLGEGLDVLLYRDDDYRADLEPHLEQVEFFVPVYMGPADNLALMARMPRLRVCQLLTAGYENALPHLPPGVTLCNAAGVHDSSTAELAVGLVIASLRGIDSAARSMQSGSWDHRTLPALADRHVMVIGAGGVGQAIRRRLESFEVTVTMVGRSARSGVAAIGDLPKLLPAADVVILAVPLDPSTEHLADAVFMARMKDGALLVNVARGRVVDTDALVAAASAGRISAALDVTDPEPLPADNPMWRTPGILITPHVGGDSSAFVPRGRRLVEAQLARWRGGEPLANVVA